MAVTDEFLRHLHISFSFGGISRIKNVFKNRFNALSRIQEFIENVTATTLYNTWYVVISYYDKGPVGEGVLKSPYKTGP